MSGNVFAESLALQCRGVRANVLEGIETMGHIETVTMGRLRKPVRRDPSRYEALKPVTTCDHATHANGRCLECGARC